MMLRLLISTLLLEAFLAQDTAPCPYIDCPDPCNYGFQKDLQGCSTCSCLPEECSGITCRTGEVCKVFTLTQQQEKIGQCVDRSLPLPCQQPMDTGPCEANQIMWYYDNNEQTCDEFTFKGCDGNDNRFNTRAECQQKCKKERLVQGKAGCSPITCNMYCEHGFKTDDTGCSICECRETAPPLVTNSKDDIDVFKVAPGCEEDNKVSCELHCPNGFKTDASGCAVCECVPPPGCHPEPRCTEVCQYGQRKDDRGCLTCECRLKGECSKVDCYMKCPFGRKMDSFGCRKCECAEDPCKSIDCVEGTVCEVFNTTEGKCVIEPSSTRWQAACSSVMCSMYCENGFLNDKYGCDVCECRTEEKPECSLKKCVPCDHGYLFDDSGCQTCQCLPDPCLNHSCARPREVCSIQRHCIGCPARPKCIDGASVQRVHIMVTYHHSPLEKLDMEELKTELRKHLTRVMNVPEENILSVKVKKPEDGKVELDFQLIEEGSVTDVLPVYHAFKSLPSEKASFTYSQQQFVPEPQTLHGEYYAMKAPPGGETGEAKEGTSLYIVIGCVAGGAVALLVGVIIAAVVVKSKSKPRSTTSNSSKNIIYRPTSTSDNEPEA